MTDDAKVRARAVRPHRRKETMAVSHPLPDDLVDLIAERFRALSEPTRIKLLDRLRDGEATVLELTDLIGTTQQNVSKHLGVLQRSGIVARRKQGNFAYYRIVDEGVFSLCEAVCGSLQRAGRVATRARRRSERVMVGWAFQLSWDEQNAVNPPTMVKNHRRFHQTASGLPAW